MTERCGYTTSVGTGQSCCWRPTWNGDDRCIWHADVEGKPAAELRRSRAGSWEVLDEALLTGVDFEGEMSFTACRLRGADFRGADVSSVDFEDANLYGTDFSPGSHIEPTTVVSDRPSVGTDRHREITDRTVARQADFTNAVLDEASLSYADFTGSTFQDASAKGATLVRARIPDPLPTDLRDADLRSTDLAGSDLTGCQLDGATLDFANLSGATLPDTLHGTNLEGAQLAGVTVAGRLTLVDCTLNGARLRGADLSYCTITDTEFRAADLDGCQLQFADLTDCDFEDAYLPGVDLSYVDLTSCYLGIYDLSGADLSNADISGCNLLVCDFSNADLTEVDASQATLTNCTFTGATLVDANLVEAELREADLTGADLTRANLNEGDLANAVLRETTLERTRLHEADLFDADLTGARIYGAKFSDARIGGAIEFGDRCAYDPNYGDEITLLEHLSTHLPFTDSGSPEDSVQDTEDDVSEPSLPKVGLDDLDVPEDTAEDLLKDDAIDDENEQAEGDRIHRAVSSYHLIERLCRANGMPELEARYFVRRQEMQRTLHREESRWGRWLRASLSKWVLLYGESPERIVFSSMMVMLGATFLYPVGGWIANDSGSLRYPSTLWNITDPAVLGAYVDVLLESAYFSILTFLSLGFGGLKPIGLGRAIAVFETATGALLLALLVYVYGRRASR